MSSQGLLNEKMQFVTPLNEIQIVPLRYEKSRLFNQFGDEAIRKLEIQFFPSLHSMQFMSKTSNMIRC